MVASVSCPSKPMCQTGNSLVSLLETPLELLGQKRGMETGRKSVPPHTPTLCACTWGFYALQHPPKYACWVEKVCQGLWGLDRDLGSVQVRGGTSDSLLPLSSPTTALRNESDNSAIEEVILLARHRALPAIGTR